MSDRARVSHPLYSPLPTDVDGFDALLGGDWSALAQHRDIFRFARAMIAFRRQHPIPSKQQFYTDAEIHWFGPPGGLPDCADAIELRLPPAPGDEPLADDPRTHRMGPRSTAILLAR